MRDEVIFEDSIMESLEKILGKEPSSDELMTVMYTLLKYLGRSKQISKRIVKDGLSQIDFFQRVGK